MQGLTLLTLLTHALYMFMKTVCGSSEVENLAHYGRGSFMEFVSGWERWTVHTPLSLIDCYDYKY